MSNREVIEINDALTYCLDAKNSEMNYFLKLNSPEVNIEYAIDHSVVNILVINEYEGTIKINDHGTIDSDSQVKIMFIDLLNDDYTQDSSIDVLHGSILKVITKFLTVNKRTVNMNYRNIDHHTEISIDNSCVSLDASELNFECVGKIVNGAKYSKNMQASRCLTIDHPKHALIKPVLLIDENEVEAAHALSSGTIDPDVLYYLNSRGISYKQAMNLIIHSYLLPQKEEVEMFGDGDAIIAELSKKVV